MGKRAYGSGSIVERRPGREYLVRIRLDVDPATGKPRRKSKVVRGTKKDAQRELTKMLNAIGAGVTEPAKVPVGELIDTVLAVRKIGDGTRQDWDRVIAKHIRPALGGIEISKLTAHRLDAHYAALRADGIPESRVLKAHEILSVVCNQAVTWGWLHRSPTANATRPSKAPKRDRAHNDGVVIALSIAAYGDPCWGLWFHLSSTVGPRRGELSAVQWSDIDLDAKEMHLWKAAIMLTGVGVVVKRTKTEEDRKVPLDDDAVEMLRERQAQVRDRLDAVGRPWSDDLYVMTHRRQPFGDAPILPSAATHWFMRLRDKIAERHPAAKDVRLGDLRHITATSMLDAGVAPQVVADILGNDPETLMANYAHVMTGRKQSAVDAMGQLARRRRGLAPTTATGSVRAG